MLENLQQLFNSQINSQIDWFNFIVNLLLATALSYLLQKAYIRFGSSISNRSAFSENFVFIAIATMLVITIVKSSLALSLGLIGALSIVRFRAAIKEPEELTFLFLAITIGLGFGADQKVVTTISVIFITAILSLRRYVRKGPGEASQLEPNLFLNISSKEISKINVDTVGFLLKDICAKSKLKRADMSEKSIDMMFLIEVDDPTVIEEIYQELKNRDDSIAVNFVETI
jgi:uncharacterized membrane protein YhiD involved in acid resistance